VETVPLTGTKFVKFRQHVNRIPVYGSLVVVELDAAYRPVCLNSNFAAPNVSERLARVSPHRAVTTIAKRAGYYGGDVPPVTPMLQYYLAQDGEWHLAYILEHVRLRPPPPGKKPHPDNKIALAFDYVVDAVRGNVIGDLPRTAMMAEVREATGLDGLTHALPVNRDRRGKAVLSDPERNIKTYDGRYGDPRTFRAKPPAGPCVEPWSPEAVSAHAHAIVVSDYLRDVLKRNGLDNKGGPIRSVVNCVGAGTNDGGRKEWHNACWDGSRMLYGQIRKGRKLHSYAASLDVVAHELLHGLIGTTSRLEYERETGALNESYCDIFAILISNRNVRGDRERHWNWELGEALYANCDAERNFQNPQACKHPQPMHMDDYEWREDTDDKAGVHANSGIHNFAAYKVMVARDGKRLLFESEELAAIFYVALSQHLSRQATFSDSRRAVLLATRSYFRQLPAKYVNQRVAAVEAGFAAAGIS
jgi:Zn-dependent metalloprotease